MSKERHCKTRGRRQGPNGKGKGEKRRGTRHGKMLGKEEGKTR